jgi:hypothetical protein
MSKRAKNPGETTGMNEVEADDDDVEVIPNLENEADDDVDIEDEDFDFTLLTPEGIKLVDLQPDFVRPEGFLMVPRLNKKTGEIAPMNSTFAGILHDVIHWKDSRGKERLWFACEATSDIPGVQVAGKDSETKKEFVKPLSKGMRVGISGTGAINALKAKKGHFIALHWTGRKVTVKNGDMWEVKARVSEAPVIAQEATK